MEVIVRNLHDQATEKEVDNFFKTVLEKINIKTYYCQKLKGRGCATLTIHDSVKALHFLSLHGQVVPGRDGFATVKTKLYHMGRQIFCLKSNKDPDQFLLLSLKKEESDRYLASQSKKPKIVPARIEASGDSSPNQRAWDINDIKCGQWTYTGPDLAFMTHYQRREKGRVIFGQRTLRVNLWLRTTTSPSHQVDIPYNSIQSFTTGPKTNPTITLSLIEAPRFYAKIESQGTDIVSSNLQSLFQSMAIDSSPQRYKRMRISAIDASHESVVGGCLCYRFLLSNAKDLAAVRALKRFPMIPDSISWDTLDLREVPFAARMDNLKAKLTAKKFDKVPFELKFQLLKLAQNGYLTPSTVEELLPVVSSHLETTNATVVLQSVRNLFGQIPFAGPETESSELSIDVLTELLVQSQSSVMRAECYSTGLADRYDQYTSIHKATVTPAGIYLYGPEPEVKNRVLRKYSNFSNHFLSVSFLDENGERLWLDRQTSGEEIYHKRYKKVLHSGISVAGRQYEVSRTTFEGLRRALMITLSF